MPSTLGIVASGVASSTFSPLTLSPVMWFDASDTATITESGGAVSQWDDKSTNGYHLTQGTGTRQPTTGTVTLNSLNVLSFDGGDDLFRATTPTTTSPMTTFIVVRFVTDIDGPGWRHTLDGRNSTQNAMFFSESTSARIGANPYPVAFTGNALATPYIFDWVVNGASSEAKRNGTSSGALDMGTSSRIGLTIGASYNSGEFFIGDFAEVIQYAGAMSDADRLLVRQYLATKWGITI